MAATRTPGIRLGRDGRFFIDKRYRGVRIGMRVGPVTQEQAEQRLKREMQQVDFELARQAQRRPSFADCAHRYLAQSQDMRSLEAISIHVRLLIEHIGHLEPHQVHDTTLAPFISQRIAAGVSATTINRRLEVARTILHRAARSYRDADGTPWLTGVPPLITMLPECPRSPCPITWEVSDRSPIMSRNQSSATAVIRSWQLPANTRSLLKWRHPKTSNWALPTPSGPSTARVEGPSADIW